MKNPLIKASLILSFLAISLTVFPLSATAIAQSNSGNETKNSEDIQNSFNEAGEALQNAGQETVDGGIQATGEQLQPMAAETIESVKNRANWGWLGLLGLIGLFGLAGGEKRTIIETREPHQTSQQTDAYR